MVPPQQSVAQLTQQASDEEIRLPARRSTVLDVPDTVRRVAVTDSVIAEAVAVTTTELLIHAKSPGATDLIVWTKAGDRRYFTVIVEVDIEPLRDHLRSIFPGESILVVASKGVITLTGFASSRHVAERTLGIAEAFEAGRDSARPIVTFGVGD